METKLARRTADELLKSGATIKVDRKEINISNSTLDEIEIKYPNFKILYFGNFVSVSKV